MPGVRSKGSEGLKLRVPSQGSKSGFQVKDPGGSKGSSLRVLSKFQMKLPEGSKVPSTVRVPSRGCSSKVPSKRFFKAGNPDQFGYPSGFACDCTAVGV